MKQKRKCIVCEQLTPCLELCATCRRSFERKYYGQRWNSQVVAWAVKRALRIQKLEMIHVMNSFGIFKNTQKGK